MPVTDYMQSPKVTRYEGKEKKFCDSVRARQAHYERQRKPAEGHWDEIFELTMPGAPRLTVAPTQEGERYDLEMTNSRPARYLRTCAEGILGSMISPHIRWYAYGPVTLALKGNDEVIQYYQQCEEQIYYRLRECNFYSAMPPHMRFG